MLLKAQSGVTPIAALKTARLEKRVTLFLARELSFLRSVADSAKLSMLAVLFNELHLALLDGASAKIETKPSIKKSILTVFICLYFLCGIIALLMPSLSCDFENRVAITTDSRFASECVYSQRFK